MAKRKKKNPEPLDRSTPTNSSGAQPPSHTTTVKEPPSHSSSDTHQQAPEEPSSEVLKQKIDEYVDALQRLKAEFDNYRKRMEKERSRLKDSHQALVIESLLPTLDAFEAAFKSESNTSGKAFRDGVRMVFEGMMEALKKLGLEKIDVLYRPFDPEIAEAMTVAPSAEHPPDHVIKEISSGYRFKDRVIRPAKVIVSISEEVPLREKAEDDANTEKKEE